MDIAKCRALKAQLTPAPQPHLVPIEKFFDGNDDLGSIGCNLNDHPGIDVFRDVLVRLLGRSDVKYVYARISELDPGDESWPFADTVVVAGTISVQDLRNAVSSLQPDEVGTAEEFGVPLAAVAHHGCPTLAVWWD